VVDSLKVQKNFVSRSTVHPKLDFPNKPHFVIEYGNLTSSVTW